MNNGTTSGERVCRASGGRRQDNAVALSMGEGGGLGIEENTYDGFGQMLTVNKDVNRCQMRAVASVERKLVHDLEFYR